LTPVQRLWILGSGVVPVAPDDEYPMCLRTHRWLGNDNLLSAGMFLCPGFGDQCSGGETYTIQAAETDGGAAMLGALSFARQQFHAQQPDEMALWLIRKNASTGPLELSPESTLDRRGRPAVYLVGAGPYQLSYQAGHEVFHVLLTPVSTHHWTHEVGAMIFSLAYLDAAGAKDAQFRAYRSDRIQTAKDRAKGLPLEGLVCVAELPFPEAFYDRALLLGLQLVEIVGPAGYHGIAKYFRPGGAPDFWAWVDSKPAKLRRRIESIIGPRNGTA
jgi:hypothetical protein